MVITLVNFFIVIDKISGLTKHLPGFPLGNVEDFFFDKCFEDSPPAYMRVWMGERGRGRGGGEGGGGLVFTIH